MSDVRPTFPVAIHSSLVMELAQVVSGGVAVKIGKKNNNNTSTSNNCANLKFQIMIL